MHSTWFRGRTWTSRKSERVSMSSSVRLARRSDAQFLPRVLGSRSLNVLQSGPSRSRCPIAHCASCFRAGSEPYLALKLLRENCSGSSQSACEPVMTRGTAPQLLAYLRAFGEPLSLSPWLTCHAMSAAWLLWPAGTSPAYIVCSGFQACDLHLSRQQRTGTRTRSSSNWRPCERHAAAAPARRLQPTAPP